MNDSPKRNVGLIVVLACMVVVSATLYGMYINSLVKENERSNIEMIQATHETEQSMKDILIKTESAVQEANRNVIEARQIKQEIEEMQRNQLVSTIEKKHKISHTMAKRIVTLACKYAKQDFPRCPEILAVIAIESNYNYRAKSRLKTDPAIGLMQLRMNMWGVKEWNKYNIEHQIKSGVNALSYFYGELHDRKAALTAYNVGLGAYQKGKTNADYIERYNHALATYKQYQYQVP